MSSIKFVRFYPSDWRSGCIGLTLEQEGLYVRICAYLYETERRLPADDKIAAKFMGVHFNAYVKVRDQLAALGKLQAHADGWSVHRAEKELAAATRARNANTQQSDIRTADQDAGWVTRQDTLGDTPPDTRVDTPLDTHLVFSKSANENNGALIEPITKSQEVKESKPLSLARPKGEAHGTRLPTDWTLTADLHQWTRTTFPQTTEARVATELETFRDYWASVPGAKGRKTDWTATWRNWCRRSLATAPIRPQAQPPPNGKSRTVAEAMAKRRAAAEMGAVQ